MKKTTKLIIFLLIIGFFFTGTFGVAGEIEDRMKARLPEIVDLKVRGIAGENNLGYLEFVGRIKEKEDVVTAENIDRKIIYDTIARRLGITSEVVGKRRAIQLVGLALTGEWLQNAAGQWYQKPAD